MIMEYETRVKELFNQVALKPESDKVRKGAVEEVLNLLGHAYELGGASVERSAYTQGVRDAYLDGLREGLQISIKQGEDK